MINKIKKHHEYTGIAIIYLGNFLSDARCINMVNSFFHFQEKKKCNQSNFHISIISTDDAKSFNLTKKKSKIFENINFFSIKVPMKGVQKYTQFYKKVNQILRNKSFNTIISGDLYSLASAVKFKNNNSQHCKQVIYDCREIYSDLFAHRKKPLLKWICKKYESYFIKKVDDIIVTADSDKEILSKQYPFIEKNKWHVIYNYPKHTNITNKKTDFNLPKNTIKIIYQGVIQKGRGIKKLIELTHYSKNISSVILGSGPAKKRYVQLTKKLNIQDKIIFIESIHYLDVFKYTQGCDIGWCLINVKGTSNQNALPNKFFEYAMMGLPVISSNLPNVKKIINQYDLGKIINNNSLRNIEKKIIHLMKNKKNPKHYNNIISQHFTFESQMVNFINIVDSGKNNV